MNLEKELIRQNRRLATPQELLTIKEYESLGELENSDVLQRLAFREPV